MNKREWILHIDGDGFFAYCEIARFPELWGKPVVAGEERGIACAMTYEAKALGVTRGMPIFKIREQFPEVVVLPCHFELYEHYARKLYALLEAYAVTVERYSIDECFALIRLPGEYSREETRGWLEGLKKHIQTALGLTYSFGLARTKVLAKIASKYKKPNGCTILWEQDEKAVLEETAIGTLWGIGYRMAPRLINTGVRTAYQFTQVTEQSVLRQYATPVQSIWYELQGKRIFSVGEDHSLPKSLQSTKSFVPSSTEKTYLVAELMQNVDIACTRMRKYGVMARAVSIFFKTTEKRYHHSFTELPYYTNSPTDIGKMLHPLIEKILKKGVRYKATGVTVWWLMKEDMVPLDFFGTQQEVTDKGKLFNTIDTIRERFGKRAIGLLSVLPSTTDREAKRSALAREDRYLKGLPLPYLGEVR